METSDVFQRSNHEMTHDEKRHLAMQQVHAMVERKLFTMENFLERPDFGNIFVHSAIAYEPGFAVKMSLGYGMFPNVIRSLGTERVLKFAEAAERAEIFGAFALTEISHGNNCNLESFNIAIIS